MVNKQVSSKRVSLRDVAAKAGIGIATASSVLNGSSSNTRVSEDTRQRIVEIAREMQYYPNAIGRALAGHPTRTIGVVVGLSRVTLADPNPFAFEVLQGIVAAASVQHYNIMLFTDSWKNAAESLGALRDGRVDGVIVIAASSDSDILPALGQSGLPALCLSASPPDGHVPTIDIDNVAGAALATNYLIELGHRRIAHLSGDVTLSAAVTRRKVFRDVCTEHGIDIVPEYDIPGTFEHESGYERAMAMLLLPNPPTAIFGASDSLAVATVQAARDCGVSVPDELSVIGFNDEQMAGMVNPPLTTIRQDLGAIGAKGVATMVAMLKGEDVPTEPVLMAPTLVVRSTTAAWTGG